MWPGLGIDQLGHGLGSRVGQGPDIQRRCGKEFLAPYTVDILQQIVWRLLKVLSLGCSHIYMTSSILVRTLEVAELTSVV